MKIDNEYILDAHEREQARLEERYGREDREDAQDYLDNYNHNHIREEF